MIKEAIYKLVNKEDLTNEEVTAVMDEIMTGEASQMLIASYLTALRMKGETVSEITASAIGMRNHGIHLEHDMEVLEIVGTGGDEASSFNISTASSFVVAAAGIPVAKHGNRSVSSKSGAADVLEALGAKITTTKEQCEEILKTTGMCFMFAQVYHSAMRFVGPVRKEIGIRTIFNILGPLTNPAGATAQLLGVYDESLVQPMAQVLMNLGVNKGWSVYGQDRLDEISVCADTTVVEIKDGKLNKFVLNPEDYGIPKYEKGALVGGDSSANAATLRAIFKGEEKGAKRDAVVLNSAACISMMKDVDLKTAIAEANDIIDSGRALAKVDEFVAATNKF